MVVSLQTHAYETFYMYAEKRESMRNTDSCEGEGEGKQKKCHSTSVRSSGEQALSTEVPLEHASRLILEIINAMKHRTILLM